MRTPCFVLVHSPLLGPATWRWTGEELARRGADVVTPSLLDLGMQPTPRWPACVDLVKRVVPIREDVVLVAHSGAGPYLPAIGVALAKVPRHHVFVDARLPAPPGKASTYEREFRTFVTSLARDDVVPPWSDWWGPNSMRTLVPDEQRRNAIESELPTLPLTFFDEEIPTPPGWTGTASYLRFSEAYVDEGEEAASRGWRVEHLEGGHLHMTVDPVAVANRLIDLAADP